jgi:hypothetical protein
MMTSPENSEYMDRTRLQKYSPMARALPCRWAHAPSTGPLLVGSYGKRSIIAEKSKHMWKKMQNIKLPDKWTSLRSSIREISTVHIQETLLQD